MSPIFKNKTNLRTYIKDSLSEKQKRFEGSFLSLYQILSTV